MYPCLYSRSEIQQTQLTLMLRRQEEVVEVQEDLVEKTCLGKFFEKLDHFNRSKHLMP